MWYHDVCLHLTWRVDAFVKDTLQPRGEDQVRKKEDDERHPRDGCAQPGDDQDIVLSHILLTGLAATVAATILGERDRGQLA